MTVNLSPKETRGVVSTQSNSEPEVGEVFQSLLIPERQSKLKSSSAQISLSDPIGAKCL